MHNCKITGNFTLSQSQLYLLQFHWSFAVDPFLSLHFLKLCSRSSGNYLKSFAVLVLPHQTIALSMVQEWQYQVRLNPFLELRHRQKKPYSCHSPHSNNHTAFRRHPSLLSLKSHTSKTSIQSRKKKTNQKNKPRHAVIFPQQTPPH